MSLKGKVVIVTGSSRGLGRAAAIAFARAGARVVIVARSETEGRFPGTIYKSRSEGRLPGTIYKTQEAIKGLGGEAIAIPCDLTRDGDVERMVRQTLEAFGRVDVLVNNAAAVVVGNVKDTIMEHWDLALQLNVRAPILCSKLVLPGMVAQRGGSIINITSGAAQSISPINIPYAVSKAALERLTLAMAEEVRQYNIAVNALNPGGMKTEGVLYYRPRDFDWAGYAAPEDICPAILFLAQQRAETFTGRIVKAWEFGKGWQTQGRI